ncbi:MAG TPA: IS66 family insertion sequence element accessory protein TnpB [Flavisolibacter sp.]|nr:IS66 family insertion sequence element accessory protein TnpB [Flavisolibacter sp.]
MLSAVSANNYFFYLGFVDMRKGFDSLSGIVTAHMKFNPLSTDLYIFINRRRTQLKLLQWEGDGFALYYKRLEKGTFEVPACEADQVYVAISSNELQMIFQGVCMKRVYSYKRYQHRPDNC